MPSNRAADDLAARLDAEDRAVQLRAARGRLQGLQAIVNALGRRDEVSAAISSSEDFAAATHALAELLDTDNTGAQAVLTLHWSSFTSERHRQAQDDLDDIRRVVADLEEQVRPPA